MTKPPVLNALLVTKDNGMVTAWITVDVNDKRYQIRLNAAAISDDVIARTVRNATFTEITA